MIDPGLQIMMMTLPPSVREDVAKYALELKQEFLSKTYVGDMAGSVTATLNGNGKLIAVHIQDNMMNVENKELVQDLIPPAIDKAHQAMRDAGDDLIKKIMSFAQRMSETASECESCEDKDSCDKNNPQLN